VVYCRCFYFSKNDRVTKTIFFQTSKRCSTHTHIKHFGLVWGIRCPSQTTYVLGGAAVSSGENDIFYCFLTARSSRTNVTAVTGYYVITAWYMKTLYHLRAVISHFPRHRTLSRVCGKCVAKSSFLKHSSKLVDNALGISFRTTPQTQPAPEWGLKSR